MGSTMNRRGAIYQHAAKWLAVLMLGWIGVSCERDPEITTNVTDSPGEPRTYFLDIPSNFPPMPLPADNPMTVEGVELGRKLFYDPILSRDGTQSCGSCHNQAVAFTDNGRRFSIGVDGIAGTRNSMALVNLGWGNSFFWDGRSLTLEIQALEPVPNPIEMHLEWVDAMEKLNQHPTYPAEFEALFGTSFIDSIQVVKVITQFERTLISGDSKFDQVRRGEAQYTELERIGEAIFFSEEGDCFHCHGEPLFTDNDFHNNGLQAVLDDVGLGEVTGSPSDLGKFRSPTLRNIGLTAPYMHDGRLATLEEVVDFYNEEVNQQSPNVDPLMIKSNRVNGQLNLTDFEKQALVAFLHTLTDSTFVQNQAFSNPFE